MEPQATKRSIEELENGLAVMKKLFLSQVAISSAAGKQALEMEEKVKGLEEKNKELEENIREMKKQPTPPDSDPRSNASQEGIASQAESVNGAMQMQIQQPNVNSDVVGEASSIASGCQELTAPQAGNDNEQPSTSMVSRLRSTRKKFNCRNCGRAFLSMVVMELHESDCKRPVVAIGSPSLIPCIAIGCGLIYADLHEMSKHLLSCHRINLVEGDLFCIQCDVCKIKFVNMEGFGIHQNGRGDYCNQTKNSSVKRKRNAPVVRLEG